MIVPPASPLAGRSSVHPAELGEQSFVGWSCCPNGVIVRRQLKRQGVEPNVVFRTDDNLTLQRLVGAGFGRAMMPELCVEREASGEAGGAADPRHRRRSMPPRRSASYWRSARRPTPALRAFVETRRRGRRPPVLARGSSAAARSRSCAALQSGQAPRSTTSCAPTS